jgi:hypothetical protein
MYESLTKFADVFVRLAYKKKWQEEMRAKERQETEAMQQDQEQWDGYFKEQETQQIGEDILNTINSGATLVNGIIPGHSFSIYISALRDKIISQASEYGVRILLGETYLSKVMTSAWDQYKDEYGFYRNVPRAVLVDMLDQLIKEGAVINSLGTVFNKWSKPGTIKPQEPEPEQVQPAVPDVFSILASAPRSPLHQSFFVIKLAPPEQLKWKLNLGIYIKSEVKPFHLKNLMEDEDNTFHVIFSSESGNFPIDIAGQYPDLLSKYYSSGGSVYREVPLRALGEALTYLFANGFTLIEQQPKQRQSPNYEAEAEKIIHTYKPSMNSFITFDWEEQGDTYSLDVDIHIDKGESVPDSKQYSSLSDYVRVGIAVDYVGSYYAGSKFAQRILPELAGYKSRSLEFKLVPISVVKKLIVKILEDGKKFKSVY